MLKLTWLLIPAMLACNLLQAQTDSLCIDNRNRDAILRVDATVSAQRQIITAEQIRLSGYQRLSDVLQLADAWTFTTINGDRWSVQANGLSTYQNQNWILMVNGQRMELAAIDAVHINMLGISITEVERIEVVNTPILYLGEYADKGIIHIITKKKYNRLSYRGYYGQGNETGDPGPFRYTPSATPNVDRIGVSTAHSIGYRHDRFSINASFVYQEYYPRDSAIGNRYYHNSVNARSPENSLTGTRLELNYAGRKWLHQLQTSYTESKDYAFDPQLATEVLAFRRTSTAGYLGQYTISPAHALRLSVNATHDELLPQDGQLHRWNVNMQSFRSNLYYEFTHPMKNGLLKWQTGVAFETRHLRQRFGLAHQQYSPYTSLTLPVNRKSKLIADAMYTRFYGEGTVKATLGVYKRISVLTNWSLIAGYAERTIMEDYDLFYYGYGILRAKERQLTADFYYNINIGNNFKLSFSTALRRLTNQPFNFYDAGATGNNVFATPLYSFSGVATSWINRFNIHYDVLDNMALDFNYLRSSQLLGDDELMQSVPKHRLTLLISYLMPARFTLWSRNYWQSNTSFIGFSQDPASDPGIMLRTLPSFFVADIGLSKKLAGNYLNLNLTLRNVLNGTEQYNTAGSRFDLRIMAGLSLNIDGVFASGAKP